MTPFIKRKDNPGETMKEDKARSRDGVGRSAIRQDMMNMLNAIIDSSYDGLWICDYNGIVMRINRASERINEIDRKQVLGKKMEDLIKEGLIDRSVTLEVLKRRTTVTLIQQLKNGKQILITGSPIFNEQGKISMVVANERDITELNRLRYELEETRSLTSQYLSEINQLHSQNSLLSEINVRSKVMQKVFHTALKVAQVDSTVLIQGETGVGKGFFAKMIHRSSKRKDGPFIRVDCGAIPESLVESELFGYEEGAFTGARPKGKPGYFEMACGGTLFIDEVGELPLSVQVKLLRFLEDTEVIRVGGTTAHKMDARIIAATHRDLEEMVKAGKFRKDLFFRINIIPLLIPPLRERPEDIPPLINFFLDQFNKKSSTDKTITPRAVDSICQYSFSGNIRELANLMEQLVVLSPNESIDWEDLPAHVRSEKARMDSRWKGNKMDLHQAMREMEKELIVQAMKTFGVQRKAASALGINQSTLARKVKKLGI
jgi:PAS domain S-box-containing protein